jgi:membrane associated rhomboid family serine protease
MIPLRDDNPSSSAPIVTWLLILANIVVFVYMLLLQSETALNRFILAFGAIPGEITGRAGGAPISHYPTLITSLFLHGGWLHIGGNMLYLWIFGDNVEDLMGHGRFLIFYLISGLAAAWTHIALSPASTVPLIGASGAIAGVLGAYLVLFPRARILSLIPFGVFSRLYPIPALLFLPLWFLLQLAYGALSLGGEGAGVAFWAHVGGFLAGVILVRLFARRSSTSWW